jgi:hypothetical protein
MPVRDVLTSRSSAYRLRDVLTPRVAGAALTSGPVTAWASAIPLLRWRDDAREHLDQVVRVSVAAPVDAFVEVAIARSGQEIDRAIAQTGPDADPVLLLVPEVDTPTTFTVTLTTGDGATSADLTVTPQRKMDISIVQHSHLDIGYTDPQAVVLDAQLAYLDQAVALIDATRDWPDAAKFRWVVEVTLPLRRWLAVRPKALREAFLAAVRSGQIEINALSMNMHTEAYSIDELGRQLAFADDLRAEHGVEIVSATQSDVPGATIGLVSLLSDAEVRYFCVAHNYAGRSVPHLVGGQDLERPFWWQAPDGGRVLVWFTDSPHGNYVEGNQIGFDQDIGTVLGNLPEYLASLTQNPYPIGPFHEDGPATARAQRPGAGYDFLNWTGTRQPFEITRRPYAHDLLHLRLQGTHSDNAHPSLTAATIVREWNETWAWPRLRTATNRDFFAAIETALGDAIPTRTGDWTDWWADGLGSAARAIGVNRRAQSEIRTAQTLHAVANALVPADDRLDVQPAVDATYDELAIFDEHTWGASNPWNDGLDGVDSGALQWGYKQSYAHQAREGAAALVAAAPIRLATLATAPDSLAGVAVFNPSGFARTDLARFLIPATAMGFETGFDVIDEATGQPVPFVVEAEPRPLARAEGFWLTLLATDVPAIGYRRYGLVTANARANDTNPRTIDPALAPLRLESPHLLLEIDAAGAFISGLDTTDGQSLISDEAPFGLNEYIYDRYTTAPGFNHHSNFTTADGNRLLGSRSTGRDASVIARSRTPLWDRVTIRFSGEGLDWLETTITLPHHAARVDIENRLHKPATADKESLTFAFPFAAPIDADVRFEVTGGVIGAGDETVPGSAHYFRTLRYYATVAAEGQPPIAWATREAPLIQQGTLAIPYAPFPSSISPERWHPATIYSWAANNLWDTNFPDRQGGEMTFSYVVATDPALSAAELGRATGATAATPLVGIVDNPLVSAGQPATPPTGSFLALDHPEVSITHLAASRRDHDLVAFIESSAAEAVTVTVRSERLRIREAFSGTFLERELTEVPVADGTAEITVPAGALVTLSVDVG